MKYKLILAAALLLQLCIYPMQPDKQQLERIFTIFYPQLKLTTHEELRKAYEFLKVMNNGLATDLPPMEQGYALPLDIIPGLPIQEAIIYVCSKPDDVYALAIKRHTNILIFNAYNAKLNADRAKYSALKKANEWILSDAKAMTYVLRGYKSEQLTPEQIQQEKSELVTEVKKYCKTKFRA